MSKGSWVIVFTLKSGYTVFSEPYDTKEQAESMLVDKGVGLGIAIGTETIPWSDVLSTEIKSLGDAE